MSYTKKRMLVVDENLWPPHRTLHDFERQYPMIDVVRVSDAGQAIDIIRRQSFDIVLLGVLFGYGSAITVLDAVTDPKVQCTGIRLLIWLREFEREAMRKPSWVAMVTARYEDDAREMCVQIAQKYCCKPFDEIELEHDVAIALGVQSLVVSIVG